MRISDLSRHTGIPIATIKFYLREGLLPPGTRTGRNQARYGEQHRRRLLLIRAFTTVGQLDLMSVRTLLAAVDDDTSTLATVHDILHDVLFPVGQPPVRSENLDRAWGDIDEFIKELGWQVKPAAPACARLAVVLATLRDLGCACTIDFFKPYAEAAKRIATMELDLVPSGQGGDGAAVMARSILLAVAFAAMRMLAEEHLIALRLAGQA
ncbi:MerR family transcriptional regulator [Rhizomonospora bruguierae]|uniref:MerR family transcriptional regulator n=1 Tax=Rhizomonospora bruguierae TaxID=1581705 RepID=UPI0020BDF696|nr:MerR family transcriptional regulator [Micromonospora sp. NBRC 107566]